MSANANLHKAKDTKNDEFYTQITDEQFEIVENEYPLNIDKGCGYVNGKRMYSRIFIRKKVGV